MPSWTARTVAESRRTIRPLLRVEGVDHLPPLRIPEQVTVLVLDQCESAAAQPRSV
jgi:hypothetical protein